MFHYAIYCVFCSGDHAFVFQCQVLQLHLHADLKKLMFSNQQRSLLRKTVASIRIDRVLRQLSLLTFPDYRDTELYLATENYNHYSKQQSLRFMTAKKGLRSILTALILWIRYRFYCQLRMRQTIHWMEMLDDLWPNLFLNLEMRSCSVQLQC